MTGKLTKAQRNEIATYAAPTLRRELKRRSGRIVVVDHNTGEEKAQLDNILDVVAGAVRRLGIELDSFPPDPKSQTVCAGPGDGAGELECHESRTPPKWALMPHHMRSRKGRPWRCSKCTRARPSFRAQAAATLAATLARPGMRAKRKAALAATHARPEVKAKCAARLRATASRPEVQAKINASLRKTFAKPDVKERLSAARRIQQASMTPAQRSANARKAQASMTADQKKRRSAKTWATRRANGNASANGWEKHSADERIASSKKAHAALTPEQRSERARNAWATRRSNAAKKKAATKEPK